jgi:hypothetical protein
MNTLIDYTDKAIMRMVLEQVKQINPLVEIGDTMSGPCETVSNGKIVRFVSDEAAPSNHVSLKNGASYVSPGQADPKQAISTVTVQLHLDDIANFRGSILKLNLHLTKRTWFHPYSIDVPSREWLEKYQLGDMIAIGIMDPTTFQMRYIETPLTQQMIDDNSEVLFRFALSDY